MPHALEIKKSARRKCDKQEAGRKRSCRPPLLWCIVPSIEASVDSTPPYKSSACSTMRLASFSQLLQPSSRLLSGGFSARSRTFASMPASGHANLLFRQLFEKESSTYTYLLADVAHPDKPAVLVDPVDRTIDRDLNVLKELGVKLIYAMNTHVHADHVTGTGLIKSRMPGVQSLISKASGAKADIYVDAGEKIQIGNLYLEVRPTPGHTSGCVTYVTGEGPGQPYPRMAFTGDALLIRGCGRTDFQGGDPRQLHKSVHSQIFTLPKETFLYPAHDYKGQTVTTVGEELLYNLRLLKDEETFKNTMDNLGLAYPKMFDVAVPANMVCGIQEVSQVATA